VVAVAAKENAHDCIDPVECQHHTGVDSGHGDVDKDSGEDFFDKWKAEAKPQVSRVGQEEAPKFGIV
jgi:hypothetical protein